MEFSYRIMLEKGLKYFLVFSLPFLVDMFIYQMPEITNITIGTGLLMLCNLLKAKYGMKLP